MSIATLLDHEKRSKRLRRSLAWPQDLDRKNGFIEIYVAYDQSQYLSSGSNVDAVYQRAKDIINIASLGFQPLGIYLVLVGIEVWTGFAPINVDIEGTLVIEQWTNYRKAFINPIVPNDHGVLITNNTFGNDSTIALAYINHMCSNQLSASLVSDTTVRPIVAAYIMDQGLGINFGVTADTDSGNCSCADPSGYCIMNPVVNFAETSLTWSKCSTDQFETILSRTGIDICLQNVPENIVNVGGSSTCGNGIVEDGEECDCGNASDLECNKGCCDSTTCRLRSGATCAYGRCCDIRNCQVLPCNTTCRQKNSDCDFEELCNGADGLCPHDTYKPDGTECAVNEVSAYCYSGLCQSRESQCQLLWGSDTLVSSDLCYNSVNILGEYYGNCGINWLPNLTYIPCNSSDVFCGRLQCQDKTKALHHYLNNYVWIASVSVSDDTCHSVIFDYGLTTPDPGLVPNGVKCGDGKMCVDQRCVDVDNTSYCTSVCEPDEVCNNLKKCQKIAGTCEITTARPATSSFGKTTKTTISITNSPKVTTLTSPSSLIDTADSTSGLVSILAVTNKEVTTTASNVSSSEMSTTFDVKFLSKTGETTTKELNPCETLFCVNGACVTDKNTATCACIEGYRGDLFEENIAECDSNPCQHESKCIDGLNSYQCQCLDGYTGRNCETDINECESNPCPINSTCEDNINRYQCFCPNPNEFVGIHCNITVPPPKQSDSPEFVETSPTHGPVSGGTRITIKGRNLDKYGGISFVYIGTMKLPIKTWTSSWLEFSVVTPVGESSMVFQDQKLTFEITGGKNISSDFIFTYQPDPEIEDIEPREHLASGGTTLTIFGNNLNSSASPFLRVILNTTTPGRLNKNITTNDGPTCDASSSNEIYCRMPRVNVTGPTVVNNPSKNQGKPIADNPPNTTTTYITLILKSDGAEDVPNKTVDFITYNGVLDPVAGSVAFNPKDDPIIHIKGRDLNIGIGANDYEIFVGAGECTNITLTANELSCRPPTEEPDPGSDQTNDCNEFDGFPVKVFAGRNADDPNRIKLRWACLVYPGPWFPWWIVGVICGVSGLLLTVTVVCFVVCRRRRLKRKRETSEQRVFSATQQSENSADRAKPDWNKIQLKALGKLKNKSRDTRNDTNASRITSDIRLSSYDSVSSMRDSRSNDYNRTLASNWTRSNIMFDERGPQLTLHELDMMAAERNAHDLRNNPASVRYSYGLLSRDDSRDTAPDYMNNDHEREISSKQDWRQQKKGRLRPTAQGQVGEIWSASYNDAISVAPALRANLSKVTGINSPLYGSIEIPSSRDLTGHKVGHHRGQ